MAVPSLGDGVATAKGRKGSPAKVVRNAKASRSSTKGGKKCKLASRRHHTRRNYTVRGNPDITRRVATLVILDKLPELASLVNLQAPASTEPLLVASTVASSVTVPVVHLPEPKALTGTNAGPGTGPGPLTGITRTPRVDSYQDSELDEQEDDEITAEDEQDLEDIPDDINSFYKEFSTYMASLNGQDAWLTYNGINKQVLMTTLVDWLGTRYLFGGISRTGIDCSAFSGTIYRSMNYKLPRTAAAQWDVGMAVDRKELQFGDLVFFHTREAVYVSHVGVYLGNNMFAHASSRNGVTVSSLDADYYTTHFIGGRRYDLNSVTTAALATDTPSHQ